jgi:hypothetical protein
MESVRRLRAKMLYQDKEWERSTPDCTQTSYTFAKKKNVRIRTVSQFDSEEIERLLKDLMQNATRFCASSNDCPFVGLDIGFDPQSHALHSIQFATRHRGVFLRMRQWTPSTIQRLAKLPAFIQLMWSLAYYKVGYGMTMDLKVLYHTFGRPLTQYVDMAQVLDPRCGQKQYGKTVYTFSQASLKQVAYDYLQFRVYKNPDTRRLIELYNNVQDYNSASMSAIGDAWIPWMLWYTSTRQALESREPCKRSRFELMATEN